MLESGAGNLRLTKRQFFQFTQGNEVRDTSVSHASARDVQPLESIESSQVWHPGIRNPIAVQVQDLKLAKSREFL
jgi:hypothetical protein